MNLNEKKILITGGGTGIGKALALQLANKQAQVIICGRNPQTLEQVKIEANSENIVIEVCDISDYGQVQALTEKTGPVDVLINNAGIWLEGPFEANPVEKIYQTLMINLGGVIYTTHAFLPSMKQQDSGTIVNISSSVGLAARENVAVYSATKFGVRGFTDSLKKELAHTNIDVIGFYPCGTKTELYNKASQPREENLLQTYIEPSDMAEVLVFALERNHTMIMDHIVVNRS